MLQHCFIRKKKMRLHISLTSTWNALNKRLKKSVTNPDKVLVTINTIMISNQYDNILTWSQKRDYEFVPFIKGKPGVIYKHVFLYDMHSSSFLSLHVSYSLSASLFFSPPSSSFSLLTLFLQLFLLNLSFSSFRPLSLPLSSSPPLSHHAHTLLFPSLYSSVACDKQIT